MESLPTGGLPKVTFIVKVSNKLYQSKCVPVQRETFPHLIRFRSEHRDFLIPELSSLSELFDVRIEYDETQVASVSTYDITLSSPFLRADFESIEKMKKVCGRSIGIMHTYEIFSEGNTFEELVSKLDSSFSERFCDGKSFKFVVSAYGKKYSSAEQTEIFYHFKDVPLWDRCPLNLSNPERVFTILIDYGRQKNSSDKQIRRCYFGLESNSQLIGLFDVKKRVYIGTTSMDSELSLLVANQALARPSALFLEPFAGTGSLMIAAALFGAKSLGGDIDRRMFDGLSDSQNVKANFEQFHVLASLLDLVVADNAIPCWRLAPFCDAILCDPPYGVRAGARRVGKKRRPRHKPKESEISATHVPQCIAYAVSDVLRDLLRSAAQRLVMGGRLVYWLPTMVQEYTPADLPLHPCLEIVANSVQPLTMKWQRRLITMVKVREYSPEYDNLSAEHYGQHGSVGHDSIKSYFHPHMAKNKTEEE